MEAEQKTEDAPPPSDRFRRTYLTTEEITRDASLAREIDSLADSDRGQAVFEALASRKEEVLPVLRRALWHQKPNVRTHVAKMLHLYEDRTEETTDALIDLLLHDADADVRSVVARVLVSHKSRRAVPALMEVVSTDPFVHARANAVRALGELRDPQAAAVVQKALHDKESWVRLRALGAVEELGLRAAKAQVELMTRDPNIEVKKKAEKVLRSL
jgi:HEAT repeat protein